MQLSNLPLWLIPIIPLLGAAWNGIVGKRFSHRAVAAVAVGGTAVSFLIAVAALLALSGASRFESHFAWIAAASFQVNFNFYLDPLSGIMTLVVTGVGLLIHIYAVGYMWDEDGFYRFFSFMNLFLFFMLTLVLAGNYLLMFVGWEGVGLCSFLLIGYYFRQDKAADAAKKAFLVTRVGDVGFMIALVLIYWTFDSLDFGRVFPAAAAFPAESGWGGPLTLICLLLLMGACGKSAQVPLYVWLPDAMMGPTPVSALIHAATMVTAGVYMIARSSALYVKAPDALLVVAIVGAVTAFYAATISVLQTDIKRVLAYSTISQIGYMIMACGVAAFSAAIFHLMTHAFFKALLFLGAGSVIHGIGGEQDIWKMGGLKKHLPRTYWTFLAACIAIAALPPFSGFFSKEEILLGAYTSPSRGLIFFLIALATAGITSFYIFRLFFLVFHGENRSSGVLHDPAHAQATTGVHAAGFHESPPIMTWPLIVLALLSVGGGWVGERWNHFLGPVFQQASAATEQTTPGGESTALILTIVSVGVSLLGIGLAYLLYVRQPELAEAMAARFHALHTLVTRKYYVDEIYRFLIVRPLVAGSTHLLWKWIDVGAIDGMVNGTARRTRRFGDRLRKMQSGNIRSYAGWVLAGAIFLIAFMISVEP
jgi:NADH-quinone oxidoreductase subunit L